MTTGEIERLERTERLLKDAMHHIDSLPVDVRRGRAKLVPHLEQRQRSLRRRQLLCVAASVVAIIVGASIVLVGVRAEQESLPIAPSPQLTMSPSGLPVGVLVGTVDRTEPNATSTIRMTVRPDGTGIWNGGTVGDSRGDSVLDYEVVFVSDGPGHAIMRWPTGACFGTNALSLDFTVRNRTLYLEDVYGLDCLVPQNLTQDMVGVTLRILPLPSGT